MAGGREPSGPGASSDRRWTGWEEGERGRDEEGKSKVGKEEWGNESRMELVEFKRMGRGDFMPVRTLFTGRDGRWVDTQMGVRCGKWEERRGKYVKGEVWEVGEVGSMGRGRG